MIFQKPTNFKLRNSAPFMEENLNKQKYAIVPDALHAMSNWFTHHANTFPRMTYDFAVTMTK